MELSEAAPSRPIDRRRDALGEHRDDLDGVTDLGASPRIAWLDAVGGPEGAEREAAVVAHDAVLGSEAAVDPSHRVQFADDGEEGSAGSGDVGGVAGAFLLQGGRPGVLGDDRRAAVPVFGPDEVDDVGVAELAEHQRFAFDGNDRGRVGAGLASHQLVEVRADDDAYRALATEGRTVGRGGFDVVGIGSEGHGDHRR